MSACKLTAVFCLWIVIETRKLIELSKKEGVVWKLVIPAKKKKKNYFIALFFATTQLILSIEGFLNKTKHDWNH